MAFPLLFAAISLMIGILGAEASGLSAGLFSLVLLSALCLGWLFYLMKKERASLACVLAAAAACGALLHAHENRRFDANELHNLNSESYMDFYGRLYKSPGREIDRDILWMKVESVSAGNEKKPVRGHLRLTVPVSREFPGRLKLNSQDRLKVSARLYGRSEFRNFQPPFYDRYLKSRGIHNRAFVKSPLLVEKTAGGPALSPWRLLSILRRKLQDKIEFHFPAAAPASISPEGAVLEALLLGEDGRMDEATVLSLQKTGLYHLFAISGAHIAIVSFLLFSLFKVFRISRRASYWLLIGMLVFYSFLVEGSPSVFRATIMTLAFVLGKLFWKDAHLLNTIALSAIVLLLINPMSVSDVGFQLTFAATLSIIVFFPKILALLPKLPLGLSELTAMSAAAQIAVLPFIALYFNRVTFSSLILNYAAIPLVGFIMGLGYFYLPVSFAVPLLGKWLARGLDLSIRFFNGVTHLLDSFRFLSYRIPTPPRIVFIGYFLCLLLLLLPRRFGRLRLASFAGFAVFLVLLITFPFGSPTKVLKTTVIDVGQGDSLLVEFPGKKKMLIDGGGFPESAFDVGENVVSPFLWRKGIKKIDVLVSSHAHPDHLNGLAAVARNFKVGEFWESAAPGGLEAYREIKDAMPLNTPQRRVSRGFSRDVDGVRVEVLNPPKGLEAGSGLDNELSMAMRIAYGRTSFFLAADIGKETEREILEYAPDLRAGVLKSAHHGSRTSSSGEFLGRIAPEIVVISVGGGNRYGLPHPDVTDRYERAGCRIFRTDLHGAVEVSSDGQGFRVKTSADRSRPRDRSKDGTDEKDGRVPD